MSTIDPGVIRAETHPEIGEIIERDADILIDRWTRRAVQEQPSARRVHHKALVDDLHGFLRALGRSLAKGEEDHHCLSATLHGTVRWEAGWSLPELVRDYQILRLVILDYLHEVLGKPPTQRLLLA